MLGPGRGAARVHQFPEALDLPYRGAAAYVLPVRWRRPHLGLLLQLHRPPEPLGRRFLVGLELPPRMRRLTVSLGHANELGGLLY